MRLSICIPTITERQDQCRNLVAYLADQIKRNGLEKEVEILVEVDNREMSIGEKRERLYKRARGKFAVQIDDDDYIPENYVEMVALATLADVDCIGYLEEVVFQGRVLTAKHSMEYEKWETLPRQIGGVHFRRTPFCKTPIRTFLCQQAGVPHIRFNEDEQFANRVRPLLKSQIFLNAYMYRYEMPIMNRNTMHDRYGV